MVFHPYIHENLVAARRTEIQHDMQQSRRQPHTGQRRTLVRSAVGRLGTLLVELGTQLQRTGQRNGAY